MNSSRATFAMIEAAAMDFEIASPRMRAVQGIGPGRGKASLKIQSGAIESPWMARCVARVDACRILSASISSTVATPIDQAKLFCLIVSDKMDRSFAESFFESLTCARCLPGWRMTAAA